MKKLFFVILVFISASENAASYTLAGDTVDASMIRTVDNGYGLGRIYGYGLDAPFVVQDGLSDLKQYSSTFTLNVDGDQFSIQFLSSAGWQSGTVFRLDGMDFSSAGTSTITALNVDTNLSGYTLNVGTDFLELGLGGTHFNTSTYFTGQFVVTPVPLPPAAWLLGAGLVGLIGVARQRITM